MREALSEALASAIRQADAEARALNQEFVGTEHLLLGILANGQGGAIRALTMATDISSLREVLIRSLPRGSEAPLITGRLPLSPKAQSAINNAIAAAQADGELSVSTRLVLLALLEEPQSAVVESLRGAGADMEQLRRILGETPSEPER